MQEKTPCYLSIQKAEKGGRGSDGFTEITARFSLIIECLGYLCNLKVDQTGLFSDNFRFSPIFDKDMQGKFPAYVEKHTKNYDPKCSKLSRLGSWWKSRQGVNH